LTGVRAQVGDQPARGRKAHTELAHRVTEQAGDDRSQQERDPHRRVRDRARLAEQGEARAIEPTPRNIASRTLIAGGCTPIDRLVHHATMVTLKGKSCRLRGRTTAGSDTPRQRARPTALS
jgi:hypothetical protein